MISYLKGKVVLFKFNILILDVNSVGYKIMVNPAIDLPHNITQNNAEIELFTHQHIREDSSDLYGFLSYKELELFELLISVNGVGPKAGLNIMNSSTPERIIQAISSDDLAFFTSISGIGKKVSAKIILDLKSKISGDKSVSGILKTDEADDVAEALITLGYKKAELQGIIQKIPADLTSLEKKVTWCLKNLAK
jgi:Holliday junction DNA helicase RuvA